MGDIERILGGDDDLMDSLEDVFGDGPGAHRKNDGVFTVTTRIGSNKIEYIKHSANGKTISAADAKAIFLSLAQSAKVKSGVQSISIGKDVFTADEIKAVFMAMTHYVAEKIFPG